MLKCVGIIGALSLCAGQALAVFTGVAVRESAEALPAGAPAGLRVFDVYATFDGAAFSGPNGISNAVRDAGAAYPPQDPPNTFGINLDVNPGANFFQEIGPGTGDTAPDTGTSGPLAVVDTYVSIGVKSIDSVNGPNFFDNTRVNSDFDFLNSDSASSDGYAEDRLFSGWGANIGTFQGFAALNPESEEFEVFLGRFSVIGLDSKSEVGFPGEIGPGTSTSTRSSFFTDVFNGSLIVATFNDGIILTNRVDFVALPPACPADLDGDGFVNSSDLASLLGAWGSGAGPADLDGNGSVGSGDLAGLLGAWGPC